MVAQGPRCRCGTVKGIENAAKAHVKDKGLSRCAWSLLESRSRDYRLDELFWNYFDKAPLTMIVVAMMLTVIW